MDMDVKPAELPAEVPGKKVVLFIGDTGTGKSKIINALLNNGVSKQNLSRPARVGGATTGTTERLSYYYLQDVILADSVGFGDRKIETKHVQQEFIDFVLGLNIKINHFYFVLKNGKIKETDIQTFDLLEFLFGPTVFEYSTLLITHVDAMLYTVDAYRELNKEDKQLLDFMDRFQGRVILGSLQTSPDHDLDPIMARKYRQPFYNALRTSLNSCGTKQLGMRVFNFWAFWEKVSVLFASLFSGSLTEQRRLMKLFERNRLYVHQEDSICLEYVLNDIYITRCGHVFHFDCLTTWAEDHDTCPNCRQPLQEFLRLPKHALDAPVPDDELSKPAP